VIGFGPDRAGVRAILRPHVHTVGVDARRADTCLRVLGGDAVNKLEAALSDVDRPAVLGMDPSGIVAAR
jgi:hypothetical protein